LLERLPQFVKKSRVLHSHDGLRGEILQEFDLIIGIGPNLLAINCDDAKHGIILPQGGLQRRARAAEIHQGAALSIASLIWLFRFEVDVVNKRLTLHQPIRRRAGPGNKRRAGQELRISFRNALQRDGGVTVALQDPDSAKRRFAEVHGPVEHCLKHRRERAGRRIDDLQHFGCGRLLLQRFA
jgi:hypothetical protein